MTENCNPEPGIFISPVWHAKNKIIQSKYTIEYTCGEITKKYSTDMAKIVVKFWKLTKLLTLEV